jgi:hypothetical protein
MPKRRAPCKHVFALRAAFRTNLRAVLSNLFRSKPSDSAEQLAPDFASVDFAGRSLRERSDQSADSKLQEVHAGAKALARKPKLRQEDLRPLWCS